MTAWKRNIAGMIACLAAILTISLLTTAVSAGAIAPQDESNTSLRTAPAVSPTCAAGWNVVFSPDEGNYGDNLMGVSALSPNDVWAVGSYQNQTGGVHTETIHWDGTQWNIVPSADLGSPSQLYAISALSTNDVWAVGDYSSYYAMTEHWNGTQWSIVPSPAFSLHSYLYSVVAISHTDAWAVGYLTDDASERDLLIEHWDGTQWSVLLPFQIRAPM